MQLTEKERAVFWPLYDDYENFSNKLPSKKVYQYFVLEELLEAGFFSQIAEKLPEIK